MLQGIASRNSLGSLSVHFKPNANIDGLLGTDFLDDLIVVMNFHRKWVEVRTGNRNEDKTLNHLLKKA